MESPNILKYNKALIIIIIVIVVFFIVILPKINNCNYKENLDNVNDDKTSTILKVDEMKCSKQCCNQSQWPVPTDMLTHDMTDDEMTKYIGSNFSCNLGNGSGCVCITKPDLNYLSSRGTNAGLVNTE